MVASLSEEERQGTFDKVLLKVSQYRYVGLKDLASTLLQIREERGASLELIGSNEKATRKLASKISSKLKDIKSKGNLVGLNKQL